MAAQANGGAGITLDRIMVDFEEREVVFDGSLGRLRPLTPDPTLSSASLDWRGYRLEEHRVPSFDSRDVIWMRDVVILQRGRPVTIEIQNGDDYFPERFLPGQVSLRPSQTRSSARCEESVEFLTVSLDPGFLQAACGDALDDRPELTPQNAINDPFVEGVCLALRDEVISGGKSGRLYSESLATSLAMHLASRYARHDHPTLASVQHLPPRKVRQAMDHIRDELHRNLSLKEIAGAVGLSPFHFSRLFKRSTGLSPHQYVMRQRVERARQLILRGELPLAVVATEAGFCDQSHMTLHFRRICGITPSAYAAQALRGNSKPKRARLS
jgi:AraC family transcriptional regulator